MKTYEKSCTPNKSRFIQTLLNIKYMPYEVQFFLLLYNAMSLIESK